MAHFPPNDTEQHCESLKKTGLVGKHEAKTLQTYNYHQLETALRGSTVPWLLNIQVRPVFRARSNVVQHNERLLLTQPEATWSQSALVPGAGVLIGGD